MEWNGAAKCGSRPIILSPRRDPEGPVAAKLRDSDNKSETVIDRFGGLEHHHMEAYPNLQLA